MSSPASSHAFAMLACSLSTRGHESPASAASVMPDTVAESDVPVELKVLTAFIPCDRHRSARSTEVWSKRAGTRTLLLSFCQHDADRFAASMWDQGFRPIMKAPVPA